MTMMDRNVGFSDGGSRGTVIPTGSNELLTVALATKVDNVFAIFFVLC